MLKHSRVASTPDVSRMGKALERPGIDTRIWTSLAVVLAVHVDPDEGVFADVLLMPSRLKETARLGAEYAGPGFGLYCPLQVDDEVLVEAPMGDPDHGIVITRRLHGASDPPPSEAVAHPDDVVLHVRSGKTLRLVAVGGGNVVISASGNVLLGDESATAGVARKGDQATLIGVLGIAVLQGMLDLRYAIASPGSNLPTDTAVVAISSASGKVKST